MYFILWLIAIPSFLYHCFFSITILCIFIYYKISCAYNRAHLESVPLEQVVVSENSSIMMNYGRHNLKTQSYHTIVLIAFIFLSQASCLEQDAEIIKPVADLIKSITSIVSTGTPSAIEFAPSKIMKNLMSLTWRTGFPATLPRGLITKAGDFYNRISDRVSRADISRLTRKKLNRLKSDIDSVADSILEDVRASPDGLYTDYTQIRVKDASLEDAMVDIGSQFKAYGADLAKYRQLAATILGLPMVPEIATATSDVINSAPRLTDVASKIVETGSNIPGATIQTIDNLRSMLPLPKASQDFISNAMSLFSPKR